MRYWEIRRDPREDERELAKKLRPAKRRPSRDINPNTAREIRVDGNGQRRKQITLKSLKAHRQWRDARAREMAKENEFIPRMYSVATNDDDRLKDKIGPKAALAPTASRRKKTTSLLSPLSLGN